MKPIILTLFLFAGVLVHAQIPQHVDAVKFKELITKGDAILLDVRTEQEFVTGHIAGAVLIPVDEIRARLAELPEDRNTPIIVYCRSGNRSATAARMLTEAGYRAVYDLGGINSWPYEIVR